MSSLIEDRNFLQFFEEKDKGRPYNFREFMEAETPGLDDTITTRDIAIFAKESINREIITIAEDARIGRNLLEVIPINGSTETFYKEYGFEAAIVPETGEIPLGKARHEKMHITPFKTGIRPQLSYESIADGQVPILQRNIRQAVLAMARLEDAHIMTVLNAGVPNGSTIKGTNEEDHSFAATGEAMTWDLFVQAYTSIFRENLTPTDIVIHPFQMAQLLKMTEFRQYAAEGTTPAGAVQPGFISWNPRMEARYGAGRIGTILGCNVWITNNQTVGVLLMIDKGNYAILAERQPILTESDEDIIHQMRTVAFTQRYAAGILNHDGSANITALLDDLADL